MVQGLMLPLPSPTATQMWLRRGLALTLCIGIAVSGVSFEVLQIFVFAGVFLRAMVYQVPTKVTLSFWGRRRG